MLAEFRDWFIHLISGDSSSWSKFQLRLSVVLSLFLQILLVWLGKRRQRLFTPWLNITIWSAYLAAGWFATISLSSLLRAPTSHNGNGNVNDHGLSEELIVLWAPFLILHLGGPDTITAYSLQDTETWLRHLLGLVIQVGTVLYINYKFRRDSYSPIQIIAAFILVAGIIKYGERVWILRFASSKHFENFVFLDKKNKDTRLFDTLVSPPEMSSVDSDRYEELDEYLSRICIVREARKVYKAFISLKMFSPLILNLSFKLYPKVMEVFTTSYESVDEAFSMIDAELGFLFDVLYTKTLLFHTFSGFILRCVCSLLVVTTLLVFSTHVYWTNREDGFSNIDVLISYLLLIGAVFLDTYAIVSNVFSRWTMTWFNKNEKWVKWFLYLRSFMIRHEKELGLIGQHNLIDYCVNANEFLGNANIFDTSNMLQKFWHSKWRKLNREVRTLIYNHLLEKRRRYKDGGFKNLFTLLDERGERAIQMHRDSILKDFHWSLNDVSFDHSLLLWHIATDLCYHDDIVHYGDSEFLGTKCDMSISISNYMVYLLVVRTPMLPEGISDKRKRDTNESIKEFFQQTSRTPEEARNIILATSNIKTDRLKHRNKSVLFDSIKLHKQLQSFVTMNRWDVEEKWGMISEVWLEMLTYAASRCSWQQHTHQLIHGRELLTRISLLMMRFGLNRNMRVDTNKISSTFYPPWKWDDLQDLDYYLP